MWTLFKIRRKTPLSARGRAAASIILSLVAGGLACFWLSLDPSSLPDRAGLVATSGPVTGAAKVSKGSSAQHRRKGRSHYELSVMDAAHKVHRFRLPQGALSEAAFLGLTGQHVTVLAERGHSMVWELTSGPQMLISYEAQRAEKSATYTHLRTMAPYVLALSLCGLLWTFVSQIRKCR